VELAQLQLRDHQYREAQASLERALKLDPRYSIAQRFLAEALLGLDRHAEAGLALDRYLEAETKARTVPPAEVYRARGLIHAATGQLSKAIQCYSNALEHDPRDVETRRYRGWAYLLIDATQLALADFEACLKTNANDADARVGRGNARIRLKRLEEALADAEQVEKQRPRSDRLLYHVAIIYSQAAAQLQADPRTPRDSGFRWRSACEERAVDFLARALEELPAERRQAFWRGKVEADPELAPIRAGEKYRRLAQLYRSSNRESE
jgi:tetratricopeptide (TPR) repeat protein